MTELVLHESCAIGDYESLEEYLKTCKYDPNCRDEEWGGKAPLHWACIRGSIECTRLLLSIGVNGVVRMDNGWTPAHCAAESGRIHILRVLHNANIKLDEKDDHGDTPIMVAKMYGHRECIAFLEGVLNEEKVVKKSPKTTKKSAGKHSKQNKAES
ncbi:ankyrin repeat domain-containing protein 66-like [Watersipora subatra]|uniref:ankyrin repeat domain-containing protein 66-like n=1 Tax=Watersipora subatra TaxID=2589382 RepID=UPI00355C2A5F